MTYIGGRKPDNIVLISAMNGGAGQSPADALVFYAGHLSATPNTASGLFRLKAPKAGIIRAVLFEALLTGTVGSSENGTLKLFVNGVTAGTLTATFTWSAAKGGDGVGHNAVTFNGLSVTVAQGDYLEIEVTSPTWVTNPTTIWYLTHYVIEAS